MLYQAATQGGSSLFHFILEDVGQVIPIFIFFGGGVTMYTSLTYSVKDLDGFFIVLYI